MTPTYLPRGSALVLPSPSRREAFRQPSARRTVRPLPPQRSPTTNQGRSVTMVIPSQRFSGYLTWICESLALCFVHMTHGCNRDRDRTREQMGLYETVWKLSHYTWTRTELIHIVPHCSSPSLGPGSSRCEYTIKVLNVVHVYMWLKVLVLQLINDGAWLTVGAVTGSTPLSISFSAWWMWFCRSFTVGKYDRLCFSGIESALLNNSFSTYRLKHKPHDNVSFMSQDCDVIVIKLNFFHEKWHKISLYHLFLGVV